MSCNHNTCLKFAYCKGVAAALILPKYRKGSIKKDNLILLGRERRGNYARQCNVCAGKIESRDNKCLIRALQRELEEEFKINVYRFSDFDALFRDPASGIRCFNIGKTLVFVGILPGGFSRSPIKTQMHHDCRSHPNNAY